MRNLDQALKLVEGREDFAVKEYDGLVCINYVIQLPDSFEGFRENFRGVTFDAHTGQIVSLPFHKFFNIGQREETLFHRLSGLQAEVYEKLDGTMIHFFRHRGEIHGASRMGVTDFGQWGLRLAGQLGLVDAIAAEIEEGYTPIFELVAPNNLIVVRYNEPRLVYLNSRHRQTGHYRMSDRFADRARRFDVPFGDVMNDLADKSEMEGYVCHLSNGMWVKAKCNWYLERHRVYDLICKPKYRLFEMVFQGVMDDVIAATLDEDRKKTLTEIYTEGQTDLLHEMRRIESLYNLIQSSIGELQVDQYVDRVEIRSFPEGQRGRVRGKLRQHLKLSYVEIERILDNLPYTSEVSLDKNLAGDLQSLGCDLQVDRVPIPATAKDEHKRMALYFRSHHSDDFHPLMAIQRGHDPIPILQERLLETYKTRYPHSIFSGLGGEA